ncbi:unnamed protein product [Leptidea sinapis]|uniref:Uncharacterized protein n=1 Tax=Leptidea sinapis TaxID=189913 RepID=A0A5E4PPU3_9NEOP|nr:unnamed protein product [Leptidea sinapis]
MYRRVEHDSTSRATTARSERRGSNATSAARHTTTPSDHKRYAVLETVLQRYQTADRLGHFTI